MKQLFLALNTYLYYIITVVIVIRIYLIVSNDVF